MIMRMNKLEKKKRNYKKFINAYYVHQILIYVFLNPKDFKKYNDLMHLASLLIYSIFIYQGLLYKMIKPNYYSIGNNRINFLTSMDDIFKEMSSK